MTDFEEAKAFLMKDENGANLFDHISEILVKVLSERPSDAVAIFEQLSGTVKNEKFPVEQPGSLTFSNERVAIYCKSIAKLHKSQADEEETAEGEDGAEAEEPLAPPRSDVIANIDIQTTAWNAAGIRFDSGDLFKFQLSLARLAGADSAIESIKLWGKLQGRDSDYYVAESVGATLPSEEEEEEGKEAPEEEANKKTYWVCKFPGGPWSQLPPVRPSAIICARKIKRFLTGNLEATVLGYPTFPGKEADFVRALIALISADCAIAPKGYFAVSEDGDAINPEEEFTMPATGDLTDVSAWETFGSDFSSLGRIAPLVSEDEEGNEVSQPEGWELQRLRETVPEDWVGRPYPISLEDAADSKAVLRSTKWPGAFAIACPSLNKWENIYIGFGYPRTETLYTPPMPPSIQKEYDSSGLTEQADVTEDPSPPEETQEEE